MMGIAQPERYKRTELVALMNLLHKLSESLEFYDWFLAYERHSVDQQFTSFKRLLAAITGLLAAAIVHFVQSRYAVV